MAIYHCSYKPVSRATGRSAVASAAYRAAERLTNERDGLTHDFTKRSGVEHAEIVLPGDAVSERGEMVRGSGPEWARDRSALWNAAEAAEKRKDSRVAGEIEVALPHELTAEQRLELTRNFACEVAERYGVAVDFAIHAPHGQTDVRNHHAHVLMTTRRVEETGLAEKSHLEWENRKLKALGLPSCPDQVRGLRTLWEETANEHLARAGLDLRIDHRSHRERGLEIEPTQHMGVHATQMERRGKEVSRTRMDEATAQRNAERIRENPEQVLTLITGEKSVFDRRDIARALHRAVDWGAAGQEGDGDFQNALAKVMASPALVELRAEQRDEFGKVIEPARYSTREMMEIERGMARSADRMGLGRSFGVRASRVEAALDRQDAAIQRAGGKGLSIEQREAIAHVTGPERIAAVVGLAGAGKSTLLAAAREAWEAEGFTVRGAALAGKAAEGLEESAGIASRTLASWEKGWERGRDVLGPRDVFVIDEAGMVGSRQLSRFIQVADAAGAKIVLVGDPEQLQPIGPGAAFRAVAERVGFVELEEIRRQREGWQREASVDFGRHRTAEGLAAYAERGCIRFEETAAAARAEIVRDVTADMDARPEGTRLVLAHRNADVQALNEAIRAVRKERGELEGELTFHTSEGERAFAPGDRVLFRENNRELGVKNGMLGTVALVSGPGDDGLSVEGARLVVRLDSAQGPGLGRAVSVSMADYAAVDHGYATTIHKAQGATVDRAYVLASGTMDRHLTYVAMTRHRDDVQLYAGRDEFAGRQGGMLVEHGAVPYAHDPANRESYYVTLERGGERHTVWGVDLERAMTEAGSQPGDRIGLEVTGSEPVRLPDGTQAERHVWQVRNADELAQARLVSQLSRSGAKETTLDYERAAYAERRGIDIRSEIIVPERVWEAGQGQVVPDRGSLVDRARSGLEASREVWDEHRGTITARGFADRQAERTLKERLPGLTAEVGRQAEGLTRAAEALDGLGERVAEHAKARPAQARRHGLGQEPEAGKEKGPELGREVEVPAPQPERKRSMFDGLKLGTGRIPADRVMQKDASRDAPAHDSGRDLERGREPVMPSAHREREALTRAVERYARAWTDAARMQEQDLPVLDVQKVALRDAGVALDAARPGAVRDLHSALEHDPAAGRAMTELQGRERAVKLVAGIERERAALANPEVRTERFVRGWQELQAQHRELRGWRHDEARGKVERQMTAMIKGLERDPQVESLLRNRRHELGLGHSGRQSEGIAHELEQSLTPGRSRGHGIGM